MRFFEKIKSSEAQHAIEYAILLTLIMAGIIIAGPYVVRSWNANLQGWDDSYQDSLADPLLEVPPASVPITGCDPSPWTDQTCGAGAFEPCTGAFISCSDVQMLVTRQFVPAGCQCAIVPAFPLSARCEIDDTHHCCTPWSPGPPPSPAPTIADCGSNAVPPCPDGQYRAFRTCDSGYSETTCVADAICNFSCTSPPWYGGPSYCGFCANDTDALPSDVMISFVESGECTAQKCEIECCPNFYPQGAGPVAFCGPCSVVGVSREACAAPLYVDRRGCGVTHFKPCCHTGAAGPPPPPPTDMWILDHVSFCPAGILGLLCRGIIALNYPTLCPDAPAPPNPDCSAYPLASYCRYEATPETEWRIYQCL